MRSKEVLRLAKFFVPKLSSAQHKGSNGRIGIFGGSLEYTGAPYFAAISALKVGADLVHVFCCAQAAPIIKGYSPELIVHPILDVENATNVIAPWLDRLHCVVIGPGLGRDPGVFETIKAVICECKNLRLPLVIDADGLYLLSSTLDLLDGYNAPIILTPNKMEFKRLASPLGCEDTDVWELAKKLKCVIIAKGEVDLIANGCNEFGGLVECKEPGTLRRCGGQGDVLAGATGVFLAWQNINSNEVGDLGYGVAAFAGATLTRHCSRLAFNKYKRSMTAKNLIEFIQASFENLFEDVEEESQHKRPRLSTPF